MLGKNILRVTVWSLAFSLCVATTTTALASEAGQAAADQVTEGQLPLFSRG